MPFTPFHFGPNGLAALLSPKRFDLPVFILVNVAVDLEPLVVMSFQLDLPAHGPSHSYTVGTLLALVFSVPAYFMRDLSKKVMSFFSLAYDTSFAKIALSSILGVWLHVALDSFLYPEMRPFYPLDGNPWYGKLSLEEVQGLCLAAFLPAAWVYFRTRKDQKGNK